MDVNDIKFSIVVPVYNRERNIGDAIESVLEQTYNNWELILVDDGSDDLTGKICCSYAENDPRIHYFYKENGGVCSARNAGLQKITGDYVLFLDSDAVFLNCTLSTLYSNITVYTQAEIICFGFKSFGREWIPEDVSEPKLIGKSEIRNHYLATHINIYPQNQNFLQNYVWNKCYKHDFLRKYQLKFDENRWTWEDGLFVVNCLDKATEMLLLRDVLHNDVSGKEVDHLSAKFFRDQLKNYIEDEKCFKSRYEKEFDFGNTHYCRHNFEVLNMLLNRTINTYRTEAEKIIAGVVNEPILLFWCEHVVPQNAFERIIKRYLQKGCADKICFLYDSNVFSRLIRKILHLIN